jgi:hypothetical protein
MGPIQWVDFGEAGLEVGTTFNIILATIVLASI